MPEIAEVRTVAKTLNKSLVNKSIVGIDIYYDKIIKTNLDDFKKNIVNKKIISVSSFGKWLLFNLGEYTLLSHLRMEGKYFIKSNEDPIVKHEHVVFHLDDGLTLRYHDVRKFGIMMLVKTSDVYNTKDIKKLGKEPDDESLSKEYIYDPLLESKGYTKEDIEDLMLLNVGPSHPASHGTIRNFVAMEGETITACVTEIGYLHRGFEKACEHHTYSQVIPYTDRLNYCSAILNNIGWAKAIEDMMGIEITPRAKMIRVVIGELSRIIDHFVCNAANMVDLGGLTSLWYLFGARDQAYDLLSKLTGARLTNTYTRIGGLEFDLYDGFDKDLEEVLKTSEKAIEDVLSLIAHNKLFHDRTQDGGVIKPDFALANGISGPNLRAAGVAHDLRKDKPYYG